ncbi:radical SAM protein [Duncaniella freteri]|uniref:radical SAM protein n=1 Tax=Duncaniella freteri TaxID=2530391 RepID=UPI0025A9814F|nr:radical SAM protein [uncultured Duncaniella sp.]
MQTVLFHSTIFGPIHSRRLGVSLGVNLTPDDGKICTFDCLYCEAGFNAQGTGTTGLPPRETVARLLESRLSAMKAADQPLDVITFSGNGEPTVHPDFHNIIDDTLHIRDRYYPDAKVSVLSNSTRIDRREVREALMKVDNNILKLDSAITDTIRLIDRPTLSNFTADKVIGELEKFGKDCIIQTMFLRGEHDGNPIDNTTPWEVTALIEAYRRINPREVMIYSIDRTTPAEHLEKVSHDELNAIARRITSETGIPVQVA